jgi:hypothetical protein
MHDSLARYTRAVCDEHGDRALALSVLEKRALSSPWSLAQSIARRLASLQLPSVDPVRQLPLPLDPEAAELNDEDAPPLWPADLALADTDRERGLLEAVLRSAQHADAGADSKRRVLRRLLARVRESALVFTEYRDTAMHLVSQMPRAALLLHGGMDRAARASVMEEFNRRPGAVLIATDAAGVGLNLHRVCRLVVNVELPWNPMRLEQRIGRVDRIGQKRAVHAIHLVACDTAEPRILARLQERITSARASIDAPDPVGGAGAGSGAAPGPGIRILDLGRECVAEAARVAALRPLLDVDKQPSDAADNSRPLVGRARRRRLRVALGGRTLLVYRIASIDAVGQLAESRLGAVSWAGNDVAGCAKQPVIPPFVLDEWRAEVASIAGRFWSARLERERAIGAAGGPPRPQFQPALFDRRAERKNDTDVAAAVDRALDASERVASLVRRSTIAGPSLELILAMLPR